MIVSEDKFPKTWQELKSMIDFIKSTKADNFRFPDEQLFYQNYQSLVDKDTRIKILFSAFSGRDKVISRNYFPYNNLLKFIPAKISHYCLWNRCGPLNSDEIEKEIKSKFSDHDYIWFENETKVKSIPEIWHCHIFVKEKY